MKPPELFGVAVRIIGLVSLIYMLASSVLFIAAGLPWLFIVKTIVWLILSLWLLRGAPALVRFAYPNSV
jgi:type IV secretory pathway VirB3-like protein